MTVKHKPATPLPWEQREDRGEPNTWALIAGGDWLIALLLHNGHQMTEAQRQNLAYIIHAANAYPKMVEALKRTQEREYNPFEPDNQSNVYKERAALLKQLGENS